MRARVCTGPEGSRRVDPCNGDRDLPRLRFYPGVVAIIWIARRATSPLTALADKKRSPSLSLLALGRFGDASGGDMGATRRNSKENLSGQSGEGRNAAPSTTA
jgi:hypothetical protein